MNTLILASEIRRGNTVKVHGRTFEVDSKRTVGGKVRCVSHEGEPSTGVKTVTLLLEPNQPIERIS